MQSEPRVFSCCPPGLKWSGNRGRDRKEEEDEDEEKDAAEAEEEEVGWMEGGRER